MFIPIMMNKLISHCCHTPVFLKFLQGISSEYSWYICSICYTPCDTIPLIPTTDTFQPNAFKGDKQAILTNGS